MNRAQASFMKESHIMNTRSSNQKSTAPTRRSNTRSRLPLLLTVAALVLVILSVFITFTLHPQTVQTQGTISRQAITQQQVQPITATSVPTKAQGNSSAATVKPTTTPTHTTPTNPTPVSTTPTLIASTPQQTQYGVFPLSTGGPIPVPEGVLHPTNIARALLNSTLVSVYAGSLTPNPQQGILCVLHENLMTGQMHISMYQSPQARGALTILTIRQNILSITDSSKAIGTFDLNTNQFHW